MKLFLCGGLSQQSSLINKKINEVIYHNKPILYIPFAKPKEEFNDSFECIKQELNTVVVPGIDIVYSGKELETKNLNDYSLLFLEDGNVLRLWDSLGGNNYSKLLDYIKKDGIIYGRGAGATMLGKIIDTTSYRIYGLNTFLSISIIGPTNGKMKQEKALELPKGTTLYFADGKIESLGNRPYVIHDRGSSIYFHIDTGRKNQFLNIKDINSLITFMDENITYGWLDKLGGRHLNNMDGFRKQYQVSSIDEMLETGLGSCIDQAKMIKFVLDRLGIENKIYCIRQYENENSSDEEVKLHCFVVFFSDDKCYYLEHSNSLKRGAHYFTSLEAIIQYQIKEYARKGMKSVTEIPDIPDGLTFQELNEYVDSFDKPKIKIKSNLF